jgi:hypothetical protein
LTVRVDNVASLVWLEEAIAYANLKRKSKLWAYLEAVKVEMLFETKLETRL